MPAVREFEPTDEAAVLELFDACEDWWVATTGQPAAPGDVQSLYYAVPDGSEPDDKLLLVATERNRIIGVIDVVRRFPARDACAVGMFLVHPDFRRRGLGTEIARQLLDEAAGQGFVTVSANVSEGWEPGLAFLAALGFTFQAPRPSGGNRNLGPSEGPVIPARLDIA